MGCATGLVKYFVFIANLIFALAGLALVIIGVLYKFNYSDATNALPQNFGLAPILSIVIGAIVFVTAFLGCCGAVKESTCMLTTYAIILLTIFIVQVAIGVYAFIKIKDENEFRNAIHTGLEEPFSKYSSNDASRDTVNVIQRFIQCCGLDNFHSMQYENQTFPNSCCKEEVKICRSTNRNDFFNDPCSKALEEFLKKSSKVVGGVAIGIAVIELHCCGRHGPDSYTNKTLPNSCCPDRIRPCTKHEISVYRAGCHEEFYSFIKKSSLILGGVILGVAIAELIGAFLGLCLANSVKNEYRRSFYS